jgi:hypothetical protein
MTRRIMQRPLTWFGAVVAGAFLLFGGLTALAQEREVGAESRTALTVTIYNRDLGLVRDIRLIDFEAGENVLALGDVSPALRPETLALGGEGLSLLDQSFAFDLLSPQRILEKSLGETVWVVRRHPQTGEETAVEAELLSVVGGVVLRIGERIETGNASGSVAGGGRIAFRGVPEGLRRAPVLVARLASEQAGARDLRIEYLTGGLTWQADYRAEVNAAEDRLDLTGLVTLTNASGAAYPDARVRLVAGEVNQAGVAPMQRGAVAMMAEAAAPAPGMAAQAAGDQHLYEVPRPVSLADRETKQVLLLESRGIPVAKEYRFEELVQAQGGPEEVGPVSAAVVFRFDNDAEAGGPGQPLPGGIVRVYQPGGGGDGVPVFIGEDRIGHTPEGEEVRLAIARAFDVTGRSRITAYERLSNKSYRTAQVITLANAKDEAVQVKVVGHLPPGWRMLEESQPHAAETANRIAWTLNVPAGGEAELTYRIQVTRP